MVNGRVLVDTNVLIYALNRTRPSASELISEVDPEDAAISIVTWMEVLTGTTDANDTETRGLLSQFEEVDLTREIIDKTISVRRGMHLKLPDAIIYASALATGRTLVTYNTRDFPLGTPSVRNRRLEQNRDCDARRRSSLWGRSLRNEPGRLPVRRHRP